MSVTKFLSPEKLFEYLDKEVKDALVRHGIRSMFNYAWEGEDTPSDEFIGLAKWSLDGFQNLDHNETDRGHYNKAEHEQICVVSTDLEALMDMSAFSIGQTLWLADQVKADVLGKNQFFWLNHINSLTLLGMASDRVRDLFIAIYFRTSLADYQKKRKGENLDGGRLKPHFYQYPFAHASLETGGEKFESQLAGLKDLGAEIYAYRDRRNGTVHDIATREAQLRKMFFANNRSRRVKDPSITSSKRSEVSKRITTNHERTVESTVQISTDWYKKLVEATSLIFDVEHELRKTIRDTA